MFLGLTGYLVGVFCGFLFDRCGALSMDLLRYVSLASSFCWFLDGLPSLVFLGVSIRGAGIC